MKLIATKYKMSQVFDKDGNVYPVTLLKVLPNYIIQIKKNENKDIDYIQIGTGLKKSSLVKKSELGHFNKSKTPICCYLSEFKLNKCDNIKYNEGDILDMSYFKDGNLINVTGYSKGRGFAGVIKRHNFSSQRMTHGNSLSHRAPGSIGQCQTPGKVFKGKKMAGRYGNDRVTVKNLLIIKLYIEHGLILVKGSVPGYNGNVVFITNI